jgi:hypothetical protein
MGTIATLLNRAKTKFLKEIKSSKIKF